MEWKRLALGLRKLGLLTAFDQYTSAEYCQGVADLEEYQRIIREDGVMLTGPDGKKYIHPLIGAVNRAETQQRQYGALFGLDPSSRASLPVVKSQEPDELDLWLAKS